MRRTVFVSMEVVRVYMNVCTCAGLFDPPTPPPFMHPPTNTTPHHTYNETQTGGRRWEPPHAPAPAAIRGQ